ncbi:MAG: right-handed parallel beta-helix repeat-containing protein [Candidatus Binataceae bacterium]
MTKRQLRIGLLIGFLGLGIGGSALAQTKITKPSSGLPVKITKSGSYFLGGNLAVTTKTTTAIVVSVSNVTINLNGFTISGVGSTATAGVGISASGVTGVIVANGTITGFGSDGISLGSNSTVQNVQIYNNGGDGVNCSTSTACYVTGSVIVSNKTGLDFKDSSSGYLNNVLNLNGPDVSGGTNLGGNVCSGGVC